MNRLTNLLFRNLILSILVILLADCSGTGNVSTPTAVLIATPLSFTFDNTDLSQSITLTNKGIAPMTNLQLPTLYAPLIENINSTCTNNQSLAVGESCNYVVSIGNVQDIVESNQILRFGYNNGQQQQVIDVTANWNLVSILLSTSTVTQAGGSVKVKVNLNTQVSSDQTITLIDTTNPTDNITIVSTPSICSLNNSHTSCIFTITTSSTLNDTSLGQKTFNINNSGSAPLNKNSFQLQIVAPYSIYYAHNGINGYTGNMLGQAISNGALGITTGIQGADYLCNHDESKPLLPVTTYKAMIVDGVNRRACYSFDCVFEGIEENIDWVLKPTSAYKNTNEQISMVTNESGIYTFLPDYQNTALQQLSAAPFISLPDNFTILYGIAFQWTGLSWLWTMYPPSSSTNTGLCSTLNGSTTPYWNSHSIGTGNVGNQLSDSPSMPGFSSPVSNYTQIAAGSRSCAESALVSVDSTWINGLICVEQ